MDDAEKNSIILLHTCAQNPTGKILKRLKNINYYLLFKKKEKKLKCIKSHIHIKLKEIIIKKIKKKLATFF